jgi:hypothetical protein
MKARVSGNLTDEEYEEFRTLLNERYAELNQENEIITKKIKEEMVKQTKKNKNLYIFSLQK